MTRTLPENTCSSAEAPGMNNAPYGAFGFLTWQQPSSRQKPGALAPHPLRGTALVIAALLALAWLPGGQCGAQEIVATPQKAGGVYDLGEKVTWRIEVRQQTTTPPVQAHYTLKKGGLTVLKEGTLDFSSGPATLQASLDEPGTLLAEIKASRGAQKIRTLAGAAIAPGQIRPSAPRPDDFDAFWLAKLTLLDALPANPQLEPADAEKPGVEYFKLRLDNLQGTHIHGQLARPKKAGANGGKYPALLLVQYAGIYGLPRANVVSRAAAGWLTLNIMAHDLPFDRPEAFYKEVAQGKLKDYLTQGDEDRERCYFLRMYLGCYRAADYLAQRPDWDGKTLVVVGTSQGGQQALVTAALHPKITAVLANVPAGCDTTGPWVGRAAGFPYWSAHARWRNQPGADKQIMETSRYFDVVNLARRIKCPALVALGLIDETCPPAGIFAACNQLQGPREVLVMVNSDHRGNQNSQRLYAQPLGGMAPGLAGRQAGAPHNEKGSNPARRATPARAWRGVRCILTFQRTCSKEETMKAFWLVLLSLAFLVAAAVNDRSKANHPAGNEHIVVPADAVKWGPSPPSLPPGGQMAVLMGDPSKPGMPYVLRAKLPDGYKVPPHWHPTDENVTILEGSLLVGKGETFEPSQMKELSAGSFMRMPRTMRHYAMAKGETILQLHGIGPFEINYVNGADDPRKKASTK